jgi:signal transduction histidine kinase
VELRHLGRMDRQIARLSRMVTDLLDVSRLERGTLRIRPVELELKQLVTEAVEELRPLSLERLLAPSLPEEAARVSADPDRIRQVLSNLVDNALKYTPADARVQVSLTLRDGTARVEVHDHGAAIPEAELKKLFSPFVRLRSAHHQEGLGLGLYISREIVARHGGRTGVTSAEGTGSVFFFELPLLARAQAQTER